MQNMQNTNSLKQITGKKLLYITIAALSFLTLAGLIIAILLLNGTGGKAVKNSDLIIPISEVTNKAKFYPVKIDGTKLEVIAVKATDNTIRTAFNTCQVCYGSGRGYYVQQGDYLVCQNCKNRFGMDEVEVTKGGCNPVPITDEYKTLTDTSIVIHKEFLTEAKVIFENWKR